MLNGLQRAIVGNNGDIGGRSINVKEIVARRGLLASHKGPSWPVIFFFLCLPIILLFELHFIIEDTMCTITVICLRMQFKIQIYQPIEIVYEINTQP